jgi:hypothetical protein
MSASLHEAVAKQHEAEAMNSAQLDAEEAAKHRKIAADHRVASATLRTDEQSACAGLPDPDRQTSPFDRLEDIVYVEDVQTRPTMTKGAQRARLEGASITVRAARGLTREYLQRLVTCHLARNASMGFAIPEMARCPLSVKGARAKVDTVGTTFRVEIRGDSNESAEMISRRAKELASSR